MKKTILAVLAAALCLLSASGCGTTDSEPKVREYDERLFGRSPIYSKGIGQWNATGLTGKGIIFSDSSDGTRVPRVTLHNNPNWVDRGYYSVKWYTAGGKIYVFDILELYGREPVPVISSATFGYKISGDTLTITSAPKSGEMSLMAGEYLYYDRDSSCDGGYPPCQPLR